MSADVTDETSVAVLSTKIDHLTSVVTDVKTKLETSSSVHVTRSEWELRNQTVDERFVTAGKDREAIWLALNSRRAPWWSVIAAIGGSVATLALLFQWIPQLVNK